LAVKTAVPTTGQVLEELQLAVLHNTET